MNIKHTPHPNVCQSEYGIICARKKSAVVLASSCHPMTQNICTPILIFCTSNLKLKTQILTMLHDASRQMDQTMFEGLLPFLVRQLFEYQVFCPCVLNCPFCYVFYMTIKPLILENNLFWSNKTVFYTWPPQISCHVHDVIYNTIHKSIMKMLCNQIGRRLVHERYYLVL